MAKKFLQGLVTLFILAFFVYQTFFQYGKKVEFGNSEVYYKNGATEDDARRVGQALEQIGFFSSASRATVQVLKEDEIYVVRFVVKDSVWNDQEAQEAFSYVGYFIGLLAFPDELLAIQLCNDELTPQATVAPKEPPDEEEDLSLESQMPDELRGEESAVPEPAQTP